ncbi:MAG: hypothetical protein M1347_06380 [Chloroflexi bacterium]|nr:hypothetical protein [Chloroflexota bacterium]
MDNKGISQFRDTAVDSGNILNRWLTLSGVSRGMILKEMNQSGVLNTKIGFKTFQQWTSSGESAKKISGRNNEEAGSRLVEIVKWFFNEHLHRKSGIMLTNELEDLIRLYEDIPVLNRLQLHRILHDLEVANHERTITLPINPDWKKQLREQPLCAFVMDPYWCIRATTHYELAFAGFSEEDLRNWGCWHRLTASINNIPKHVPGSPMSSSRGPYAREYYVNQLSRFRHLTKPLIRSKDSRMVLILELLNESPYFKEVWELSLNNDKSLNSYSIGFPVPFFKKDDTLLWMMELSVEISNSDGLHLIHWTPINRDSNFYIADFCKKVDRSGNFTKSCYFIEDYAHYFTENQRKALNV